MIANFREAGINFWVLTGDKAETAINIAYSSQTFSNKDVTFLFEFDDADLEAMEAKTESEPRIVHEFVPLPI